MLVEDFGVHGLETSEILKKFCQYLLVVVGCLHLIGGPNCVIQTYAWVNMLVTYSQETSFSRALSDTFSGQKPCDLCKKISEVQTSEDSSERREVPVIAVVIKSFQDLFPPTIAILKGPSSVPLEQVIFPPVAEVFSLANCGPPVPPPRC